MAPTDSADESVGVSRTPSKGASSGTELQLHPLLFLFLSIIAGVAFVAVSQPYFPPFRLPPELQIEEPTPEEAAIQRAAEIKARLLSATVAGGTIGLLMGGLLAIGEAAARRFKQGALVRLVVGVVLGTAIGVLAGLLGQMLLERLRYVDSLVPIGQTTLAHACTLGLLGLGVGAAVGLVGGGVRRLLTCIGAGAISGVLVGMVFPALCAFAFYRLETEVAVIPGGVVGGRHEILGLVLWMGLVSAAIGIILPLVARGNQGKRGKSTAG